MGKTRVFDYRDNTGGCNLRASEANINQSEARTEMRLIQNMEIYREGGFQSQKGNIQINTGVTDETAILGIGEYRTSTGVKAVYTKASGKAYAMDAAGGAETEIKSGLSLTAVPEFVNFNGKVLCFNGVNTPWAFDGVTTPAPDVTTPPVAWGTTKPHTACNIRAGRLLAAAGSGLYWCKQGDHNNWTAANDAGSVADVYMDVAPIRAVESYGRSASVHTGSNRIYIFGGSKFDDYAVEPMASNRSAIGKLAAATVNDYQWFFSGDAILPVTTTDLGVIRLGKDTEISQKIHPFLSNTEGNLIIPGIDRAKKDQAILLPYDLKNELIAYFKTDGALTDAYDVAAIFGFNTGAWVFRRATPVTAAGVVDGQILTGTVDGKILQEFTGRTIASGEFRRRLVFPWFDFGAPHLKKRVLRMWVWVRAMTDLTLHFNFRQDFNGAVVESRDVDLRQDPGQTGFYDSAVYGLSVYGGEAVVTANFPLNLTGTHIQPEFVNENSTQEFRIIRYAFEVEYLDAY